MPFQDERNRMTDPQRPRCMTRTFRASGVRARHGSLRTLLIAGAALVGAGLAVTACSASSASGSGGGSNGAPIAAQPGAPVYSGDKAANSGSSGVTSKLANLVVPNRSIIYTANLTLRVVKKGTVTGQADQAASDVTAVGGYVSGEQQIVPPGKHQ